MSDYETYYMQQAGSGLPFYAGARMQRGHGLGSILSGLFRAAIPLIKKTAVPALKTVARKTAVGGIRALKKKALETGVRLASDAMRGRNMKQAVTSRLKQMGEDLLERKGIKRRAPPHSGIRPATKRRRTSTGRKKAAPKKKVKRDIFG